MKRIATIAMALMPMVTISSATSAGFEEAYNKTSFADYYKRYIDNNMQAPVWDGTDRFLYSIRVENIFYMLYFFVRKQIASALQLSICQLQG